MITTLTSDNLSAIRNPAFAAYADRYRRIHDDFMAQVAAHAPLFGSGLSAKVGESLWRRYAARL